MIAKKARDLRKRVVIEKTWIKNGKVFIKYKLANGDFNVMLRKNLDELNASMDWNCVTKFAQEWLLWFWFNVNKFTKLFTFIND